MDPTAQIITSIGTLLVGVISAFFAGFAMLRSGQTKATVDTVVTKVEEIRHLTNSLSDRSNTAERAAGRAEGQLEGRDHSAAVQTGSPLPAVAPAPAVTTPGAAVPVVSAPVMVVAKSTKE